MADGRRQHQRDSRKTQFSKKVKSCDFTVGQLVFLKRKKFDVGVSTKLQTRWLGLYRIIKLDELHAIIVSVEAPTSKPKLVHRNQIKPAFDRFGPPITYEDLPVQEKSLLKELGAQDMDIPGYLYREPERKMSLPSKTTVENNSAQVETKKYDLCPKKRVTYVERDEIIDS